MHNDNLQNSINKFGKLSLTTNSKGKYVAKVKTDLYTIAGWPELTINEALTSLYCKLNKIGSELNRLLENSNV